MRFHARQPLFIPIASLRATSGRNAWIRHVFPGLGCRNFFLGVSGWVAAWFLDTLPVRSILCRKSLFVMGVRNFLFSMSVETVCYRRTSGLWTLFSSFLPIFLQLKLQGRTNLPSSNTIHRWRCLPLFSRGSLLVPTIEWGNNCSKLCVRMSIVTNHRCSFISWSKADHSAFYDRKLLDNLTPVQSRLL